MTGLEEDPAQGDVAGGGGMRLVAGDDLDVEAASVAGICATKVV